ncbi:2,3-bisphosphoglycerate-dependent phosphoglycerate mutase [Leifsonia aquatica]|uniref:2,3-bisphosphoglycerate-dependent phosphoglycerate mutase n=1 Tax=Leifsonia aquatica TaxID=144185 RepID=UPI0013B3DE5B|nr:2,3-bisphosphoglycerate-dependent phosphoglycerate mutase [Leifsonia aquatica]
MTEQFAEVYLLRHGESTANARGLFTGVLDPELTELGREEAHRAAMLLLEAGVHPARVFCSALQRTTQTAQEMSAVMDLPSNLEIDWRLGERNYGALTGFSKTEVARRAGQARYRQWRRSYDVAPPPMSAAEMTRLRGRPPFNRLPARALTATESLADVVRRITPFLDDVLLPAVGAGRPILVIAHGNSLRALLFVVQQLTREQGGAAQHPHRTPVALPVRAKRRPLPVAVLDLPRPRGGSRRRRSPSKPRGHLNGVPS